MDGEEGLHCSAMVVGPPRLTGLAQATDVCDGRKNRQGSFVRSIRRQVKAEIGDLTRCSHARSTSPFDTRWQENEGQTAGRWKRGDQ